MQEMFCVGLVQTTQDLTSVSLQELRTHLLVTDQVLQDLKELLILLVLLVAKATIRNLRIHSRTRAVLS